MKLEVNRQYLGMSVLHTGVSKTLLPMNKRFSITQYYGPGSNSIEKKLAKATTRVVHSQ
jgi:hypothetical protein